MTISETSHPDQQPAASVAKLRGQVGRPAPPKPPFSLSIGVVGHRPDRLPKKDDPAYCRVEEEVARVLRAIRREARVACDSYHEFFATESQVSLALSLVTALAEGADTMVARAASEQHYAIDAVLPFERTNYEDDFKGGALLDFKDLFGLARSKLTLYGARDLPPHKDDPAADKAYEAAGLTVIGNCDIVLTVWDGGESAGRGGTTDMLVAAAGLGIPIIHVDAGARSSTVVKWNGLDKHPVRADKLDALSARALEDALPQVMDELVRPPGKAAERKGLRRYFNGRFWSLNPGIAFPLLLALLGVRRPRSADLFPVRLSKLSERFLDRLRPAVGNGLPPSSLLRAHVWADAVGLHFAQFFRSAFVVNFFLAAFAVAAALSGLLVEKSDWPSGIELVLIATVTINTLLGRHYGWHTRWFEAREAAERLRVASMLWVLGIRPQSFSGEEPAWTGWYARAFVRLQPLRSCSFGPSEIDNARAVTIAILQDQCAYHEGNARRMSNLESRLEWIGFGFFLATMLVALDHVLFHPALLERLLHHSFPEAAHHIGIALGAFLPALATATYGIRVIGDFEGNARRSERARASLQNHIAALLQDPPNLDALRRRARAAGEAMLGDVASWRLAVESRELAIPG